VRSNPPQTQYLFPTCSDKNPKFEEENTMEKKECDVRNKSA